MIAADYLYTNYLCRIALIMSPQIESGLPKDVSYITTRLGPIQIYFRHRDGEFILENQYGEKEVNGLVKSLLALLIHKALMERGEDKDEITINGEVVKIDHRVIPLIGFIWGILKEEKGHGKCSIKYLCPLSSICHHRDMMYMGDDETLNHIIREGTRWMKANNALFYLITEKDRRTAYIKMIDTLSNRENEENDISRITTFMARDIGYDKADVITRILVYYINNFKPIHAKIDPERFGGYLTEENGYIFPSDKVWTLIYEEGIEKFLRDFYRRSLRFADQEEVEI